MGRKLFCEISPVTYAISIFKCRVHRHICNFIQGKAFARKKSQELLPVSVYRHNSLIRRRLGTVDMQLQENKAVNLSLVAPKINGVLIHPGEVFSFWALVGSLTKSKGYLPGLTIEKGGPGRGIGGGMCQFTNLIHWMVLHTPLTIIEHHHHDGYDLFPDYGRQIPFGTGTSVFYQYLDYRFQNNTDQTYQLLTYTTPTHLCGEIRSQREQVMRYHIYAEDEHFIQEKDAVYRCGRVYRKVVDTKTGVCLDRELIRENHAKVLYDTSHLDIKKSQ